MKIELKNGTNGNAFFSFWDKEIYLAYPRVAKQHKIDKKLRDIELKVGNRVEYKNKRKKVILHES
jgi:hypothetical protein